MNLILFGFKSCGKSYFGKLLADSTGYQFLDTDEIIERLYEGEHQEHLQYRQIFKKLGGANFRELERLAVSSLENTDKSVIAVGGGAIIDPYNREILEKIGQLVYLELDKQTLKQRILSGELPAYFDQQDPENFFEKIYQNRIELYEKIPAKKILLTGKSDQIILEELKRLVYGQ